jgi:hypothetical protein
MAVGKLPVRSCLINGEAIVCDDNGLAVFELIRRHGALASAVYCAFDLLEQAIMSTHPRTWSPAPCALWGRIVVAGDRVSVELTP